MWYGLLKSQVNYKDFSNQLLKKRRFINYKIKNLCLLINLRSNKNTNQLSIYIPPYWQFIVVNDGKKNQSMVYMYSPVYFLNLTVNISFFTSLYYDHNIKLLVYSTIYMNNYARVYWQLLQQILQAFYRPFFKKLKFKGKGYYIYKNKRNTITPQFGHAHRIYVYSYGLTVQFLSKTNMIIYGLSKQVILTTALSIKYLRKINIFTGRGVRYNRQIIFKKTGKVSTYR